MNDCPPAELMSGALVGPYVSAAALGIAGMRGKGFSLGMVLDGEEEDLWSHHPVPPQLGGQPWEAPSKCGLRVMFISDPLNCPKPLDECAIPCP